MGVESCVKFDFLVLGGGSSIFVHFRLFFDILASKNPANSKTGYFLLIKLFGN